MSPFDQDALDANYASLQALRHAAHESPGDLVFLKVAANENETAHALFLRLPVALQIAVEKHVHALEDKTLRLVLEGEDALRAQDRGAFPLYIVL